MRVSSERNQEKTAPLQKLAAVQRKIVAGLLAAVFCGVASLHAGAQAFSVTNILSDGSVPATTVDPNFINPWGVSASPVWWISAAGTGYNYVVQPSGTIAFKVIVPLGAVPTANGLPSGSVTAAGSTGLLLPNGTAPSFLFSTLDGTISGWNSKLGTNNAHAQIVVNNSATSASYTGLALLNTANGSFLLAPNFATAAVEVYDSTYKAAKLAGTFTDPNLPANYAPFSIHILGTQIFIAYTQRTATAPFRSQDGVGVGVLDVFDTAGNFVTRAVTGGNLNSPWGVAFAPANFGIYSNDLLVGNFGDGKINVYDPKTYAYVGQVMDSTGKSLVYASLWDLLTGGTKVTGSASVSGGDLSTVYFTAGLDKEAHGLLGAISSTSTGGASTFGFTTADSALIVKAGSSVNTSISVAPVNGFSGSVTLTCTGLPVGATCTFAPSQLSVSPTAAAISTVTIQTTSTMGALRPFNKGRPGSGIALASLVPFVSLLCWRKKRPGASLLRALLFVCAGSIAFLAGCGDTTIPTPAGSSSVAIVATSGATSQQTMVALTVQ
ncbi:TIGR03118 family protein [Terriglobus saanensis]|uniref:TIGR03118 family protein n=1 Tax=Terriglobus saanensis (strain ATCC BAA-1853 / DSM 23119 / SP1PR4) TaxID=401053 RepID=E8V2Q9_TERSS|nr:TIGR03118 family protein [Terriglobus saanensis]ADV83534.1 hypothetical protein AciPR4_2761 [Terriglobus saanensis SP1PR4]